MNSEQHSSLVINALQKVKAQKIIKLDVRNITTVTDFMIVASGTSTRHIKALADKVSNKSCEAGYRPIGIEGQEGSVCKDLKIGICGEHGGDPDSIEFCNRIGLDYVSCSPFRVPIARLAAAHAKLKTKGN